VRPIMMTALATVAGMIPLALALGAGSQMLQPLAIRGDWWNSGIDGAVAGVTPAVHYYLAGGDKAQNQTQAGGLCHFRSTGSCCVWFYAPKT